jgi:hypothetical protein
MGTCADGRPIACWERPNGRPPEAPKCGNLLTASKHPRYLKRGNLLENVRLWGSMRTDYAPVPPRELFLWTYDERQGRQQWGAVVTWVVLSARRIGYP